MAVVSTPSGRSPTAVLLRALVTRSPLLRLDPSWFSHPDGLGGYPLVCLRNGFWLPIHDIRLVPRDLTPRFVALIQRAKAIYGITVFCGAVVGVNSLLTPFGIYSKIDEHMMVNIFFIGILLILLPAIALLWRDWFRLHIKSLPIADVNERVRAAKRTINVAYWAFHIVLIVLTALLEAIKASAARAGGNDAAALEVVQHTQETAVQEVPALAVDVAEGTTSVASSFGLGVLRSLLGGGITVGSTFLMLELFSATEAADSAGIFFSVFGIGAALLVGWEIHVFRKYRMPPVQPA
jgi:hypothetical protein